MGTELQRDLIARVSDLLQVGGELSLFELVDRLRAFRNDSHPDRFQDEAIKAKASERFQNAQALLDELEVRMESDRFNRPSSDLVLYKPLYDAVSLQGELDRLKRSLDETSHELAQEREISAGLQEQLDTKQDDRLASEIEHLMRIYRPSKRGFAQIGLVVVLSGLLAVMSQMEKVSVVLSRYAPFESRYISTGLFVLLVVLLATTARKTWESSYVRRRSEEICSPRCAQEFMEHLREQRSPTESLVQFSEVEAFDYIHGRSTPWKRAATLVGFQIFRRETTNRLKDIFLHDLLNKKLIEFSSAGKMQRYFKIKDTAVTSDFWLRAYMQERDKNQRVKSEDEI